MKKKVIGLLIGMMMLATIPIAAGMYTNDNINVLSSEPESKPTPEGGKKTIVIGVKGKTSTVLLGTVVTFRAISVRYLVTGEGRTVNVGNLQRMFLRNDYKGILGNHFVFAIFEGRPIAL